MTAPNSGEDRAALDTALVAVITARTMAVITSWDTEHRSCSVDGCRCEVASREMCNPHYRKWLRNLDGPRPPVVWPSLPERRPPCVVDGCHRETRSHSSQWCETHYYRNRRNGHLELLDTRKPVVTYGAAHQRIRYDKGSATKCRCVICGKPAQQWSYDNADPNELTQEMPNGSVCRYSLDQDHYQPACLVCHKRRDHAHRVITTWNYPPTQEGTTP